MARAMIDRSQFSSSDWRCLAKHLREFALGMMDDRIRARINRQAHEYEAIADRLDKEGSAPAPMHRSARAIASIQSASNFAPVGKSRLFRRMLEWRPRRPAGR